MALLIVLDSVYFIFIFTTFFDLVYFSCNFGIVELSIMILNMFERSSIAAKQNHFFVIILAQWVWMKYGCVFSETVEFRFRCVRIKVD